MKRNILIGICGGIASYKTVEAIRQLIKYNCAVKVVMTEAATKFVTPLVFKTVSNNPVYIDMFHAQAIGIEHIALSEWVDLSLVAPLSANTLSKIACGICDNLLTTIICALSKKTKVIFVPSMNERMWENPIIQENLNKLKKQSNYHFLYPQVGELACGESGRGRMVEADKIVKYIKSLLKK
ncbi:MAG: flavoprotein [Candidatus Omnitrophota bacterium]